MYSVITILLGILLAWGLITPAMIAIGRLVCPDAAYPEAFFAGFAIIIPLLMIYHLVAPINQIPFLVLALIGLIWLGFHWRRIKITLPFVALCLIVAIFAVRYAFDAGDGLYHIQTVNWFAAYPIVPGLANLHTRFGFDSSYYVFAALFRWLPDGATQYPTGMIWLATFALLLRSRFGKLLLFPLCLWFGYVSSLSNDFVILCLTLIIGCKLFDILNGEKADLKFLTLIMFVGITVKLSFAVFGFAALGLVIYLNRASLRPLIPVISGGVATLGIWMLFSKDRHEWQDCLPAG